MHFLNLCFFSTCHLVASLPHRLSSPFEQGSELGVRYLGEGDTGEEESSLLWLTV